MSAPDPRIAAAVVAAARAGDLLASLERSTEIATAGAEFAISALRVAVAFELDFDVVATEVLDSIEEALSTSSASPLRVVTWAIENGDLSAQPGLLDWLTLQCERAEGVFR